MRDSNECRIFQWTNYVVNVSNIVVWPDYPRFPGPIFFNVTMDVSEELPQDKIEMDVEVSLVVYDVNLGFSLLNLSNF